MERGFSTLLSHPGFIFSFGWRKCEVGFVQSGAENISQKEMVTPEKFHYWLLLQVISHISVNVTDLSGLVTEPYSGEQLTCNYVL